MFWNPCFLLHSPLRTSSVHRSRKVGPTFYSTKPIKCQIVIFLHLSQVVLEFSNSAYTSNYPLMSMGCQGEVQSAIIQSTKENEPTVVRTSRL